MTVIEGKFSRRDELTITIKTQLLYIDEYVAVVRLLTSFGPRIVSMKHMTVDLTPDAPIN